MNHHTTTKYVCGIDLHSKNLSACVMDLPGKILKKRSIACQKHLLIDFLTPWAGDITVGVESTYNWYWLIDCLERNNITACLGHALYIKRTRAAKHKNDPVDARGIADLLRTNQFPLAYSYPPKMRATRDLLRRRKNLVSKRAGTLTHFQCTLHQQGCIEPLRNKLQYKSTRNSLVSLAADPDVQTILQTDLDYIAALDTIILQLDKTLVKRARLHNRKHFEALKTMPGCVTKSPWQYMKCSNMIKSLI